MATVPPMAIERQRGARPDRRRVPRGGRRTTDRTGLHPTILVADSYEGARRPCARYLDRFHFQVVEASTLVVEKWAAHADKLGAFKRWGSPSWRAGTLALR